MKVSRTALLLALQRVKPALSTQDYIPVMKHFCFTGSEIYAYNEVSAISVPFETGLEVAVPDSLLPIIASYTSDEVSLELTGEGALQVKGTARTKAHLAVLPAEDFLYKPPKKFKHLMAIDGDLLKGITLCLNNVGDGTLRPSLMGITLSPDKAGCLYSTDNITLSRYRLKQRLTMPNPIILPRFFCQQLVSWLPEGKLEVATSANSVVALTDGRPFLVSHLVQGEPEEFAKVLGNLYPEESKETFCPLPEHFRAAIARALVVKQADSRKDIKLVTQGNKMSVSAHSQYGRINDRFLLEREYDEESRTVKGDLLNRACGMCDEINFLTDVVALRQGTRFLHLISLLGEEPTTTEADSEE